MLEVIEGGGENKILVYISSAYKTTFFYFFFQGGRSSSYCVCTRNNNNVGRGLLLCVVYNFFLGCSSNMARFFLYTAAIERVCRNGRANGLLSLVHLLRFFVRLIFLFFCRYYSPICNGIAMVRSRDGLAAVSSEDEGEERNENSWQLQFPLSCVRIESLCDSVGCRRKVTQSERKKAAQHSTAHTQFR